MDLRALVQSKLPVAIHVMANCRIAFEAGSDYPDIRTKCKGGFEMTILYVSVALLGAAIIRHMAAKNRRERLQPVRVRSGEQRNR